MLELWFSTPVFYAFAPPLTKKAIEEEYFSKEKDIVQTLKKECWGDNIDASYHINSNLFEQFQLKQLETYVVNCTCGFLEQIDLGVDSLRLDNSWVNYSSKYNYIDPENINQNKFNTIVRQICKYTNTQYIKKLRHDQSKYSVLYHIYFPLTASIDDNVDK